MSGFKNGYRPWESEGVSNTARDIFCDEENLDLLQLHRLMSSIFKIDYAANISDLTKRENMLRGHILENSVLQNSDRKDPRTVMLVWDMRASYGLTPFRSDFIYIIWIVIFRLKT